MHWCTYTCIRQHLSHYFDRHVCPSLRLFVSLYFSSNFFLTAILLRHSSHYFVVFFRPVHILQIFNSSKTLFLLNQLWITPDTWGTLPLRRSKNVPTKKSRHFLVWIIVKGLLLLYKLPIYSCHLIFRLWLVHWSFVQHMSVSTTSFLPCLWVTSGGRILVIP